MRYRVSVLRLVAVAAALSAIATPVVTGALPTANAAKTIEGPDVSHFQHVDGKAINWTKVAAAGKSFAISKATEGTTYKDPYFATDYPAERAAGLVHGSYHFAHPAVPLAKTALAQATFFAGTVGAVTTTKTLPPALDLEMTGGLSPAQLVTWTQDFLLDMRTLTGRTPMLYTYLNFWENDLDDPAALARYPLWMADYAKAYPLPPAPGADMWQSTDKAKISGIPGGVDQSEFLGASGLPWASLSNGTVATPWKAAAPSAPVTVQATPLGGSVTVSWLPGDAGTSIVTGYTVTTAPGGKTVTVGPGTFHATVTGLSTTASYTFTVTATNAVGTSPASAPTTAVIPTIPTVLNASVKPSLSYGSTLPLAATLLRADTHAALPDQKVLVFRRTSDSAPWRQIRVLATDTAGSVSSTLRPSRSAQLEAVFPGAKGVARSTAFENYAVRPLVTAALSAKTIRHNGYVAITGSVSPYVAGTRIVRQSLVRGIWTTRAESKVSRHGTFRFAIHPLKKAVSTYRIVVAAAHGRAAGFSAHLTLTVS
jgi:lysozyme